MLTGIHVRVSEVVSFADFSDYNGYAFVFPICPTNLAIFSLITLSAVGQEYKILHYVIFFTLVTSLFLGSGLSS
jgi:hypothetical protein